MPYATIDGLDTFLTNRQSGTAPTDMLQYDKNCVAMAFSKCLGIGVYPTINFFINKGWIAKASDLENDNAIDRVLNGLNMSKKYFHQDWASVKIAMKGEQDGRYFCVNRETREATGNGHAFAIIINRPKKNGEAVGDGAIGVAGNNQEKEDSSYNATIKEMHKVSVYGPIAH